MNYLLDTNTVVAVINDRPPLVRLRLRTATGHGSISVSSIVAFEL